MTTLISAKPKRRGTLQRLRELYPQEKWSAYRHGLGWSYRTESGWDAGWRSVLSPRYDGDDETSESRFYIYRPQGPAEQVFL
jgi:hypothetical protein